VDEYRLNNRDSLDELERRIKLHLRPFFGGRRMENITTADLVAFTKHRKCERITLKPLSQGGPVRERQYSNAEINLELATLKRMFNLVRKREKLSFVPHFEMLKESNARKGFLERAQVDAMAARLPEPLNRLLMFAYITGWRIPSEIFTLKTKNHVYLQDREVRLDPELAKNDDGRVFPFTDELENLIRAQIVANEQWQREHGKICPWLFHRNGKKICRFERAFKKACREVGLPDRIPHDFRRTAVRNLIKAGVSEKVAMLMTGHKTRSVFDRYNIVNEEDMRGAATKLDELQQRQLERQGEDRRNRKTLRAVGKSRDLT
jgi:integrase